MTEIPYMEIIAMLLLLFGLGIKVKDALTLGQRLGDLCQTGAVVILVLQSH